MVQAPIFHVNGDDPEAVVHVARIATEFRQQFQARRGHRHGLLSPPRPQRKRRAGLHPAADVRKIAAHPTTRQIYAKKLVAEGVRDRRAGRQDGRPISRRISRPISRRPSPTRPTRPTGSKASGPASARWPTRRRCATNAPTSRSTLLKEVGSAIAQVPEGFNVNRKIVAPARSQAEDVRDRRRHRLGDRRGAGFRHAAASKARRSACRARIPVAAPSRSAIPCWSTRRRGPLRAAQPYPRRARRSFEVIDSLLSEDGRAGLRIWLFAGRAQRADPVGRRSSAISPTARR